MSVEPQTQNQFYQNTTHTESLISFMNTLIMFINKNQ